MNPHLRYGLYVARHKWYVFRMGRRLGIPFLAALHDNSKLRPSEWFPYVRFFYGKDREAEISRKRDSTGYYKPDDTGNAAFDQAWFLHQKRNKHHWQWYVSVRRDAHVCPKSPEPPLYGDMRMRFGYAPSDMVRAARLGLLPKDDGTLKCVMCGLWLDLPGAAIDVLPMADKYRREMLADWWGAGKAQGKHSPKDDPFRETRAWYDANRRKMRLHHDTVVWLEREMGFVPGTWRENLA